MPSADSTTLDDAPVPERGSVIGGRYRLKSPAGRGGAGDGGRLWLAEDTVLSRPVGIRLLVGADEQQRGAFLAAAAAAGRTTTPLLAATYDAAEEPFPAPSAGRGEGRPSRPICYVVREWVEGTSLHDLLVRDGPLPPDEAAALLRDAAHAVARLHAQGHAHGRIHPGNLLVRADGQLRVCDAGVALALEAEPAPASDAARAADTLALGRTCYAALTARWPEGPWRSLPAAPRSGDPGRDEPLSPRQVRAGVPRALDEVVTSVLGLADAPVGEPITDTVAFADALDEAGASIVPGFAAVPDTVPPGRHPRRTWAAVLVALVVLLAVALGVSLTHDSGGGTSVPEFHTTPDVAAAPGAPTGAVLPLASVTSFDPPPGDGSEYPADVGLAHDGNPATFWHTQTYTSRDFGHIKPGVGLLVDLGAVRRVQTVTLAFPRTGSDVQLRALPPASSTPGPAGTLAAYPLVAAQSNVGTSLTLRSNVSARYWLIWLTGIPQDGNGYRGAVAEMTFRS